MADFLQASNVPQRAWYGSSIDEFVEATPDAIIGRLSSNSNYAVLPTQRDAWLSQIALLRQKLVGITGSIFLEFEIPRMGRRIDAVLLVGPVIFAIEFKVGESSFDRSGIDQVWDYALDLKNFHEASHAASIVPILIATEAEHDQAFSIVADSDKVYRPITIAAANLRGTIDDLTLVVNDCDIDAQDWIRASYHPTPTIIEAARALYAQHSVEAIARYDAGAKNLRATSKRIEELIDHARSRQRKAICFVTGVPGAGKTLVGLNVATHRRDVDQPTHAVFLSGNGPLVAVLREALTRDEFARQRKQGLCPRKGAIRESVKAFIQNVHHFRDDLLIDQAPPAEHVAIFDEAQRAWNVDKTSDFMRRKKKRPNFSQSEPEFLIASMERHPDWAVIVCLVGGGQEINTGEAGIDSWVHAINKSFPHWDMYISARLTDSEFGSGGALESVGSRPRTYFDESLHLAVSMRSFRAENVSEFVRAVLDREKTTAKSALQELAGRYPIVVSRSLSTAKNWILAQARGTERFGVVASSKAQRLKPDAIDIRVDIDPIHWFLNDRNDTRSSYYMEDAATEFQVQGLELDWACVAWDGDLRYRDTGWEYRAFRGDNWLNVLKTDKQRYLLNAYRVLLTRARQGMVIYVPKGDTADPTRSPSYYDGTYLYLRELGVPGLE